MNRIALIAAVVAAFVTGTATAGANTPVTPVTPVSAKHLQAVPARSASDSNQANRTRPACSSIWTCWY